ncbi:hypothetical protein BGZ63DRAFT_111248 [Mariannaea sp. PMI_226]|nr:hypothetical protein BGZ63DRAFT_111248 [Mariannaea sp. PMI_226]
MADHDCGVTGFCQFSSQTPSLERECPFPHTRHCWEHSTAHAVSCSHVSSHWLSVGNLGIFFSLFGVGSACPLHTPLLTSQFPHPALKSCLFLLLLSFFSLHGSGVGTVVFCFLVVFGRSVISPRRSLL